MAKSVVLGGEIYFEFTVFALFLNAEASSFLAISKPSLSLFCHPFLQRYG